MSPITMRTTAVIVLAFASSQSPLTWYPTAVAATVRPTKVAIVTIENSAITVTTVPVPKAAAAKASGKSVRSGEAATPNGTAMVASLAASVRS